jgi:hypothetical protein
MHNPSAARSLAGYPTYAGCSVAGSFQTAHYLRH